MRLQVSVPGPASQAMSYLGASKRSVWRTTRHPLLFGARSSRTLVVGQGASHRNLIPVTDQSNAVGSVG